MSKQALALAVACMFLASPAVARPWHGDRDHREDRYEHENGRTHKHHKKHKKYRRHGRRGERYGHRGYGFPRHAYRSYGYGYRHGHRHHRYRVGNDPFFWLGLTAVGITAIHTLSHAQQAHWARAQQAATRAPIGERIVWNEGAVTPVREGYSSSGEYCREFQQEVRIDGRLERAYGTACLGADGDWRVIR